MLLKNVAASAAVAMLAVGGALAVAAPAEAAPALTSAACHAHRVAGTNHWTCVTPGSYCPAVAHGRYGSAVKTGRRYQCARYSNGRWRWKRA